MQRGLLFLSVLLGLSGCATERPAPEPLNIQSLQDEVHGIGALKSFELHARLALKKGFYRETLVLDWYHSAEQDQLRFSTPLGTEMGEVEENASGATLRWVNQSPKSAEHAASLLQDSIGVAVPLDDLARWVQGQIPKDTDVYVEGARDARVMKFQVLGWAARLERWRPVGQESYPGLVTLEQNSAELKMVIDRWNLVRHD